LTSAAYQNIDLVRLAGVIYVLINNTIVAQVSPSPFSIDTAIAMFGGNRDTSGTTQFRTDYLKLWARTAR